MKNAELHKLVKIKAKKYGLTEQQIKDIVDAPWKFLRYVMKEKGNRETLYFPSVRIPFFGIFYCPDWIMRKLTKDKKEKDEAVQDE